MSTPSRYADLGKYAEGEAKKWLDARSARESGFAYHRYPDARAARGALASQPSDFLVAFKSDDLSFPSHLEIKETKEERRLPKAKVSQYGKLKLFHMAGFETYIVVYRSVPKDWTWFDHDDLFNYDVCPASFPFVPGRSFATCADILNAIYQ